MKHPWSTPAENEAALFRHPFAGQAANDCLSRICWAHQRIAESVILEVASSDIRHCVDGSLVAKIRRNEATRVPFRGGEGETARVSPRLALIFRPRLRPCIQIGQSSCDGVTIQAHCGKQRVAAPSYVNRRWLIFARRIYFRPDLHLRIRLFVAKRGASRL